MFRAALIATVLTVTASSNALALDLVVRGKSTHTIVTADKPTGAAINVLAARQVAGATARYRFREWFGVARTMLATAFAQQYLRRIDVILLAAFVRPEILGMYSLGARFAQVLAVARFSVNRFWMPRVARRYAAGDEEGLQSEITTAARAVFASTILATIGLLLLGPYLIEFAGFGEGIAFQAMAILLIGQLVAGYYSPSVQTLQMCGHERSANRLDGGDGAGRADVPCHEGHRTGCLREEIWLQANPDRRGPGLPGRLRSQGQPGCRHDHSPG